MNKKEVQVYDYADVLVPMLARMYKKRLAGYGALGYTLTNELRFERDMKSNLMLHPMHPTSGWRNQI